MVKFRNDATKEEIKEFECLVAECRELGFTTSKQVSEYIMKNKLGEKYKHISADLHLQAGGASWVFQGGILPEYYKKLCTELGIANCKG